MQPKCDCTGLWIGTTFLAVKQQIRHKGLPTDQDTIDDFVNYIQEKMRVMHIGPDHVANFDKTNCYFSPELAYTIVEKGSRTVSVA